MISAVKGIAAKFRITEEKVTLLKVLAMMGMTAS